MALRTGTMIRIGPKGTAQVDASIRPGGDSWIACHTYPASAPILQIEDENVSVTVSARDPKQVSAEDVAQAHRLADALAAYIADLEQRATTPCPTGNVAA